MTSGNLNLVQEENTWLIFVTDKTGMPDCNKASGFKIFSCMEVNDTNPLNNLSFTLKNSKKLLIDALIMFSGNMMYNRETGQVTMKYNGNVQALLDKYDHYLKPLQDRGMKVLMGIMPDMMVRDYVIWHPRLAGTLLWKSRQCVMPIIWTVFSWMKNMLIIAYMTYI